MRLQVEIAAASRISPRSSSSPSTPDGAALRERHPLAQLQGRGLVRDAERQELAHAGTRSRSVVRFRGPAFRQFRELGELAVDAREAAPP